MKLLHSFLFPRNGRYFSMTNITTQKLALGVLLAFVLAFGVIEAADAGVTFRTTSSSSERSNYQRQQAGLPLATPINFSVSGVDTREGEADQISITLSGLTGARIDEIRIGSTKVYVYDGGTDEEVAVTLYGAGTDSPLASNDVSGTNAQKLRSGTVTVYLTLPDDEGILTVTVADLEDADGDETDEDITFTVFSVQNRSSIRAQSNIAITLGGSDIYSSTGNQFLTATVSGGSDSTNVLVNFEVDGGRFEWPSNTPDPDKLDDELTLHTGSGGTVQVRIRPSSRSTLKVKAWIEFTSPRVEEIIAIYYQDAVLDEVSGDEQEGFPGTQLPNPLVVRVEDGGGRSVSEQRVTFRDTDRSGELNDLGETIASGITYRAIVGTQIWLNNKVIDVKSDHAFVSAAQASITVISDNRGEARVYAELPSGAASETYYEPMAQIVGFSHLEATQRFVAIADPARSASTRRIRILSGDRQSVEAREYTDPLVVMVESRGQPVANAPVTFDVNIGTLEYIDDENNFGTLGDSDGSGSVDAADNRRKTVVVMTDANGKASVEYGVGADTGVREVDASTPFTGETDEDETVETTFYISVDGAAIRRPSPPADDRDDDTDDTVDDRDDDTADDTTPPPTTPRASNLRILSGNSQVAKVGSALQPFVVQVIDQNGSGMDNVSVTFSAIGGGSLSTTSATTNSSGQAQTTLTLGSTAGTYSVDVNVPGLLSQRFTAVATAPILAQLQSVGETIRSVYVGTRITDPLEVRVLDTDSDPVQGVQVTFTIVSGGTGTATPATQSSTSDTDGAATAYFTPTAEGTIMIDAAAVGLPTTRFTLTATLPPSQIIKVSGDDQAGAPGKKLSDPFVVEIQDANGKVLSGITLTFDVTAGGGSVSPATATTDAKGQAKTTLTLGTDRGKNSVDVLVEGVAAFASFNAVSGSLVRLAAAQRPALYWVDTEAGTLHRLVGDKVENLASAVRNATSIAIDAESGYIYWTSMTNPKKGAIRRAGLNGRGVRTVKALASVPTGIAVDTANNKLYWSSSGDRIKTMSTGGGRVTSVVQNLSDPTALTVSDGVLYWTESVGRVRSRSLSGNGNITNIATGLGEPLGIAVAGGRVYWAEKTNGNAGRIMRADLDGSNRRLVKNIASGPIGISVDTTANKLYWTNTSGRIKRSNLSGSQTQNVVTDLVSPGALALENVTADAPAVETTTTRTTRTTTPTTYSKYDINRDGSVNSADTKLVAGAVGQSGNDITNPRTDVNKDGTVDVTDLILVIGNLDDDAAAPAVVSDLAEMNLNLDRIQEQIDMLLASGDTSFAAQRTLAYLQQLLASARPDETVLLANFPNPFNPETWIPYHLATGTDVKVNIYDARGTLVRALTLGHQSAGYYTSRSRAAYWDGRNALGERVASGIYFYQLQTDEVSPMRKMVILK